MAKTSTTTKSYAEEGLEDIQQYSAEAEENVGSTETAPTNEDEFFQVGGVEPVEFFYRLNAPKKPTTSPWKILEKGKTITGTYERSFVNKASKFNKGGSRITYLVRGEDGKLFGLPNAGSLDKGMAQLAEGSKVKITYQGMAPMKAGEFAGTDAHTFIVLGNKRK